MNKTVKFMTAVSVAFCITVPLASCNRADLLDAPAEFVLDENYNLKWTPVENARSYLIEIKNINEESPENATSRRENITLSYLEAGDYDIRVKAIGDGSRFKDSDWSSVVSFDRAVESGCQYRLVNNGSEYELSSASASATELVLEDSYRGKPVTSIGDSAFRRSNKLETLVLGKNVAAIGDAAFYNCVSLKDITIPDTVTYIGASAFQMCNELETFTVPSGVTRLSDYTFANCRKLRTVDLNNVTALGRAVFNSCAALESFTFTDKITEIGESAFEDSENLKEVTFGNSVETIGSKAFSHCTSLQTLNFGTDSHLKSIRAYAFEQSALTSVTLPDGLESIGNQVFYNADKLQSVTIPDSVTMVGAYAFHGTNLYNAAVLAGEKIVYADKWLVEYVSASGDQDITFQLLNENPDNRSNVYVIKENTVGIADRVFAMTNVQTVKLSRNIRIVGASAFNYCPELYRFDASESALELLDIGAFGYSEGLQQVYFDTSPNSKLKEIGNYAFYGCKALDFNSSATGNKFIPNSVERIGAFAFRDTGLYEKADEYGVIYADDWVVGCTGTFYEYVLEGGLTEIVCPNETFEYIELKAGVKGISDYAFYNCRDITSMANTQTVENIGRGAFYNCTNLLGFRMNSGLQNIGDYTFYGCSSLVIDDSLPSAIRSIGRSAFYGCSQLQTVSLTSRRLESVGDFAFYGCRNLTSLGIGAGLEEIGDYTFYGCERLTSVTIPGNVKKIGKSAFSGCKGLTTLILSEGIEEIGDFAFRSNEALQTIELPDSVKKVGDSAFLQCHSVMSIDLGRVEEIGDFAFAENFGVSELVIPDSVKTIGRGAFYCLGADTLSAGKDGTGSVIIAGSPEKIDAHAFYGCNFLTFYAEDGNRNTEWGAGWNSSRRPTAWGVMLSEDKTYVVSLTVQENTFDYFDTMNGIRAPYRENYTFAGWSLSENGAEIAYTSETVASAPVGTTLYAVYIHN